jgi:hypothetical protein
VEINLSQLNSCFNTLKLSYFSSVFQNVTQKVHRPVKNFKLTNRVVPPASACWLLAEVFRTNTPQMSDRIETVQIPFFSRSP